MKDSAHRHDWLFSRLADATRNRCLQQLGPLQGSKGTWRLESQSRVHNPEATRSTAVYTDAAHLRRLNPERFANQSRQKFLEQRLVCVWLKLVRPRLAACCGHRLEKMSQAVEQDGRRHAVSCVFFLREACVIASLHAQASSILPRSHCILLACSSSRS